MPSRQSVPKLCCHKATGQGYVTLNGREHYLGRFGSAEAEAKYEELIARWLAHGRRLPEPDATLTVNEVLLAYDCFAETHYKPNGGKPSTELECVRDALRIVKTLFGRTPAAAFGPKRLKAVRAKMLERGWCRGYVNHQVDRVRRVFKWAVAEEMVPGEVFHALEAVGGLRRGMPGVRESLPVKPAPEHFIDAAKPLMPPPVQAMVELQLLTGMRPGEACIMRACDLEVAGTVWVYRPASHKTEHHGKAREVYLGPRAQEVVRPWLKLDTTAYLFSPAEAEAARNAQRRQQRRSPMTPSQAARRPKRHPGRPKRDRYDVASYRRAIRRACDWAFPLPERLGRRRTPEGKLESQRAWLARLTAEEKAEVRAWRREHQWHPHQLRHNAATNLRREYGVELARIVLGHATAFTTEIYAEADRQQAIQAIARIG
jgi:integrase